MSEKTIKFWREEEAWAFSRSAMDEIRGRPRGDEDGTEFLWPVEEIGGEIAVRADEAIAPETVKDAEKVAIDAGAK